MIERAVPDDAPPPSHEAEPTRPLVSVIIPAYNASTFVAETLASAQAQIYPNLEIIVVDDGSIDGTAAIVKAAATDPRITLIRQANAGVAAARNRAIAAAKGKYVAPLDADDLWHPENVQAQVEALERAGPGTAVAYAWHVRIDADGRVCGNGPRFMVTNGPAALDQMIKRNFIGNGSSTVIRRDHLLRVGGYNTTLRSRAAEGCEDVAVYIALAEHWNFAPVPRCLVGYRQHQASMSRNSEQMQRSRNLVLMDLKSRQPRLAASIAMGKASYYATQVACGLLNGDVRLLVTGVRQARMTGARSLFLAAARLPGILAMFMTSGLRRHVWVRFVEIVRPGSVCRLPNDWRKIGGKDSPGESW